MIRAEADGISEAAQTPVRELRERQQRKGALAAEAGIRVGQAGRGGLLRRINQLRQRRAAGEFLRMDLIGDYVGAGMEPCAFAAPPIQFQHEVFGNLRLEAQVEALDVSGSDVTRREHPASESGGE